MVDIIAFKAGRRETRPGAIGATAQILWFTGVRYMRVENIEDLAPPPPPRRRAKTRRVRASIVCA